jgi:hypothetical protein
MDSKTWFHFFSANVKSDSFLGLLRQKVFSVFPDNHVSDAKMVSIMNNILRLN